MLMHACVNGCKHTRTYACINACMHTQIFSYHKIGSNVLRRSIVTSKHIYRSVLREVLSVFKIYSQANTILRNILLHP